MIRKNILLVAVVIQLFFSNLVYAETQYKPFIMASSGAGDMAVILAQVKNKLGGAGFKIAGEYSPYPTATILVITSDFMQQHAAQSDFGSVGAAQRVAITKAGNEVQVSFTNPTYMANVYRMKTSLTDLTARLKGLLGDMGEYGPDEGLTAEELREYHYKFLMPYFDDHLELASYTDHATALAKVEAALAGQNKGGVKKVYRIDIPGKQESVFGVHMTGPDNVDCSGDKYIMNKIDFKPMHSTPHLPYEIVVKGNSVYSLMAEFRIAISFPDLSMMGSNSFASIMCAPSAIKEALTYASGSKPAKDEY